ncbi:hypothetical protein L1987_73801 [Smallanthus sonchifolius]|uniref:Uncharacterized protein n=1 Tax=Smallanthus sonchifolius TaxID=185202 RepID=A0ACB9A0U1_9ASTR|nr:hypothetical protein L1987_73801 [Smallanthus sonchifolius]
MSCSHPFFQKPRVAMLFPLHQIHRFIFFTYFPFLPFKYRKESAGRRWCSGGFMVAVSGLRLPEGGGDGCGRRLLRWRLWSMPAIRGI